MASQENQQFDIFFFPFMAPSHMIPSIDMAVIFSKQGIKSTIVTTPSNIPFFTEKLNFHNQKTNIKINLLTIKFPSKEAGLPQGYENSDMLVSTDLFPIFIKATNLLQQPLEELMELYKPNCLISDFFFPWAYSSAKKFGIPCIAFHGSCYFSQCIMINLLKYEPHKNLSFNSDVLVVPGDLPDRIELVKSELSPSIKKEGPKYLSELMEKSILSIKTSYGVIMNSFYELESDYVDYYEKIMGKHWHIGPFMLHFNEGENGPNDVGKMSSINASDCIKWLDEKKANSVIYVCFGSQPNVQEGQLYELALALEDLDQNNYILVVKKENLNGFEPKVKEKGLVIRGWAPQTQILSHVSTGAFVTHCGWNSILEGVIGGVPMITWPQYAEQFYNEKLITDVLRIGVQIGAKVYPGMGIEVKLIGKEEILGTIKRVLVGEEANDMRNRVKALKEMAMRAVSEGGSSYNHLNALIEELKSFKKCS